MNLWRTTSIGFLLITLSASLFFACKKTEQIVKTEIEEFKLEHHLIIGKTMATQIGNMPEMFPVLDSAQYHDAYTYLYTLVNTLKLTSVVKHRDDFHWRVTILHNDNIQSAFTLPGGHIYVYTGLLRFLNAEHELMAVLANEIAYADKELSALELRDEYGGVFLGDITLGKEAKELPEAVESFPFLEFSTERVLTADEYAIKLICPFQYDINGLQDFLKRADSRDIEWITSKKGEELEERLEYIATHSDECGEGGVTNFEQYNRKIKNFLP